MFVFFMPFMFFVKVTKYFEKKCPDCQLDFLGASGMGRIQKLVSAALQSGRLAKCRLRSRYLNKPWEEKMRVSALAICAALAAGTALAQSGLSPDADLLGAGGVGRIRPRLGRNADRMAQHGPSQGGGASRTRRRSP